MLSTMLHRAVSALLTPAPRHHRANMLAGVYCRTVGVDSPETQDDSAPLTDGLAS